MLVGYARVSTQDQNLALQITALKKGFCRSKERGANESDMMRIAYAANE